MKRKTFALFLTILVISGLFFQVSPAQANVFDNIGGAINNIWSKTVDSFSALKTVVEFLYTSPVKLPLIGFAALGDILGLITSFFTSIAVTFADWVVQLALHTPVSPTDPNLRHTFIYSAYAFMQGLGNIVVALSFLFVGLTEILKVKEYEGKKLFWIAVVVALFINFSPLIVEWTVKTANIIGKAFYYAASPVTAPQFVSSGYEQVERAFGNIVDISLADGNFYQHLFTSYTDKAGNQMPALIGQLVMRSLSGYILVFFNLLVTLVYIGFSAVLFVRITYLWILAITAPLAFSTFIFRRSKVIQKMFPKFLNWEGWLDELLSWSFLIVPLTFTLFLANGLFLNLKGLKGTKPIINTASSTESVSAGVTGTVSPDVSNASTTTETAGDIGQLVADELPSIFGALMLFLGTSFSMEMVPGAAKGFVAPIAGALGAPGRAAGQVTAGAGKMTQQAGKRIHKGVWGGLKKAPIVGGGLRKAEEAGKKIGGLGRRLYYGKEEAARQESAALAAKEDEFAQLYQQNPDLALKKALKGGLRGKRAYVRAIAKTKGKFGNEAKDLLPALEKGGATLEVAELLKHRPDFSQNPQKAVSTLSPDAFIKNVQPEALTPNVVKAMTGDQIEKFLKSDKVSPEKRLAFYTATLQNIQKDSNIPVHEDFQRLLQNTGSLSNAFKGALGNNRLGNYISSLPQQKAKILTNVLDNALKDFA